MVKTNCRKAQFFSTSSEVSKNTFRISSFVEATFWELRSPGAVELLKQVRTSFLQAEGKAKNSSQEEIRKSIIFCLATLLLKKKKKKELQGQHMDNKQEG